MRRMRRVRRIIKLRRMLRMRRNYGKNFKKFGGFKKKNFKSDFFKKPSMFFFNSNVYLLCETHTLTWTCWDTLLTFPCTSLSGFVVIILSEL